MATLRLFLVSAMLLMSCVLLVACGDNESTATTTTASTPTKVSFARGADIKDAESVMDISDKKEGDLVALHGRVKRITKGFASFVMIDDELEWCGRDPGEDCGCPTPWDYCCADPSAVKLGSITVELRDKAGDVVEADDLGLRVLDWVAVRGTLAKNEAGGLYLISTDGWHRRERPTIDGIDWSKAN